MREYLIFNGEEVIGRIIAPNIDSASKKLVFKFGENSCFLQLIDNGRLKNKMKEGL